MDCDQLPPQNAKQLQDSIFVLFCFEGLEGIDDLPFPESEVVDFKQAFKLAKLKVPTEAQKKHARQKRCNIESSGFGVG